MADSVYTLDATIGPLAVTISSADDYDPEAPVQFLDPLTFTCTLPEGTYPAQPDPLRATIRLRATDVSAFAGIGLGSVVALRATTPYNGGTNTFASFYGRVADSTLTPVAEHARTPLGDVVTRAVYLTLVCVDYTADLAEVPIRGGAWPQETADDRWARIAAEAVRFDPTLTFDPMFLGFAYQMNARTQGPTNALAALTDLLRQVVSLSAQIGLYLRPVVTGDVLDRYEAAGLPKVSYQRRILPGTLALAGPQLGLVLDPLLSANSVNKTGPVFSGCACTLSGEWRQDKRQGTNTIRVSGDVAQAAPGVVLTESLAIGNGQTPPVSQGLDVDRYATYYNVGDFTYWADVFGDLARYYLPAAIGPDSGEAWTFDKFAWRASEEPDTLSRTVLISDHTLAPTTTVPESYAPWCAAAVVTDLQSEIDPTGKGFYAGHLTSVSVTISRRKVSADLVIERGVIGGRSGTGYSYDHAQANHPTVRYTAAGGPTYLDPALTYSDAQLVRSP